MAVKVRNVQALPHHRLDVEFSDGTCGTVDLSKHVLRAPFLPLASDEAFSGVHVEQGSVEWPGVDVGIATEALYALVHELPKPETLEEASDNELRVSLRELRKFVGKTQAELAESFGVSQGALSHFENAPDHRVSALRKYVAMLGGDLEVTVVIGSKRFPLHGA